MKKKTVAILLILILFFISFGFAYENAKETELLFMAKKAYEDGFYEVSLGMLERFQNEFGASDKLQEARLLSGQCYFYQGRYLEALNIFEKLLNVPQCKNLKDAVYFWIAEVHFKGNNFEKAITFYQKLISEFPLSAYCPAAYYSLGWSLSEIGKFSQAQEAFNNLLVKFPNEPQSKDATFKLIECLYNLKKYAELRDKVKPIFKLYSKDPVRLPYLYFYLAESEYYLDNLDEALRNYLRASVTSKEQKVQVLAKLGLGWSYLKLKKYKEAEDVFTEIKQNDLDKKNLDILILGRAMLMSQTNRVYEARKLYEQLINITGDNLISIQAYLGKADALYNLAEYAQAETVYKEGLEKITAKTGIPEELIDKLHYNLASAYIKQDKINLAVDIFEKMIEKSNDQAKKINMLFQIGDGYKDAGEFIKAEDIYAKILKLYPDSSYADYAQYQIGFLQLKRSDYNAALDSFKLIIKNYPQSKFIADAVYSSAIAYFQKADYAISSQMFARFQNEFKDSPLRPQASYMLATSLISLGKINEALSVYKSIIKLYPKDIELLQKTEYEIADCYYKLGQEDEAVSRFKLLRTKYPDSKLTPDILCWIGQYYYRHNELNIARRYLSSLIKDFPDSNLVAQAYYILGLTFRDENMLEQAANNFKLAINLGNSRLKTRAWVTLAKSYYKLGDYEQAKLSYAESLMAADANDLADIRFGLAEVFEAKSEIEQAIQQYLLAADFYTQAPSLYVQALLRAARLYEDKENFKEALVIYQRIIEKGTQEAKFAQERIEWIKENANRKDPASLIRRD